MKSSTVPKPNKKLSKSASATKHRKAYDNAKHRCAHSKTYNGTQFLFNSYEEFTGVVELPERSDQSLDRIDPHGHYAPGNVRWVNKAVQSANKKKSWYATHAPIELIQQSVVHEAEAFASREAATAAWHTIISCYRGKGAGLEAVRASLKAAEVLDGFKGQKFPRYAGSTHYPHLYRLPSLTRPGQVIQLFARSRLCVGRDVSKCAGAFAPIDLGFEINLPAGMRETVARIRKTKSPGGAMWSPEEGSELNPVTMADLEAALIATAWLYASHNINAAVLPALTVLEKMTVEFGTVHLSAPLDGYLLFIPDFQVSGAEGWKTSYKQCLMLSRLVEARAEVGLYTFIGVENARELPNHILRRLLQLLEFQKFTLKPEVSSKLLEDLRSMDARALTRWKDAREAESE